MAIKMRTNKEPGARCCECGAGRKTSLDMFDVCIGGTIQTICDLCNEDLFRKTLTATCNVNHRLKSQQDMQIITRRKERNESWQR